MRILIADDDPVSRRLLERTLHKLGHEVVAVSDGLQAREVLTGPEGPSLAVLDWMMPGLDGIRLCEALRRQVGPYVYVILLTAKDRREDLIVALDAEVDEFLTKPIDPVELRARLRSGERVLNLQEALRREATLDRLTGLKNRGAILDYFDNEHGRMVRSGQSMAVILIDVDLFKQVNDTWGHLVGDVVLRECASRLRYMLREYDGLGRYGGEEFLCVIPECEAADAEALAERLRSHVAAEPVRVGGVALPITLSAGLVATDRTEEFCPADLLHAADIGLYLAKTRGRNRVVTVPPDPDLEAAPALERAASI